MVVLTKNASCTGNTSLLGFRSASEIEKQRLVRIHRRPWLTATRIVRRTMGSIAFSDNNHANGLLACLTKGYLRPRRQRVYSRQMSEFHMRYHRKMGWFSWQER